MTAWPELYSSAYLMRTRLVRLWLAEAIKNTGAP
jgi:hypothetical protein